MKKLFFTSTVLLTGLLLAGCAPVKHEATHTETGFQVEKYSTHFHTKKHNSVAPKIDLHKKYKGFALTTVPEEYRGTWYRADPYSKKATKLVITTHTFNGFVTYRKTDPNLKLDPNSEKQNKEYAGNAVMISTDSGALKERGFLDIAEMSYKLGQFKDQDCLFMSYGTNPKAVNGVAFKDKKAALKYRKYDFSKVNQ